MRGPVALRSCRAHPVIVLHRLSLSCVLCVLCVAGCFGTHARSSDPADSEAASTIPGGPHPAPPAGGVTFVFTVPETTGVHLSQGCDIGYSLYSLATGEPEVLPLDTNCAVPCSEPDRAAFCGACLLDPLPIDSDSPVAVVWDGAHYVETRTPERTCLTAATAGPGPYRIAIVTYDTVTPEAIDGLQVVELDFELPVEGGVLEVPVR